MITDIGIACAIARTVSERGAKETRRGRDRTRADLNNRSRLPLSYLDWTETRVTRTRTSVASLGLWTFGLYYERNDHACPMFMTSCLWMSSPTPPTLAASSPPPPRPHSNLYSTLTSASAFSYLTHPQQHNRAVRSSDATSSCPFFGTVNCTLATPVSCIVNAYCISSSCWSSVCLSLKEL